MLGVTCKHTLKFYFDSVRNIFGLCIRLSCPTIKSRLTSHISCILQLFLVSYNDADLACYAALFGFGLACPVFYVRPCVIF